MNREAEKQFEKEKVWKEIWQKTKGKPKLCGVLKDGYITQIKCTYCYECLWTGIRGMPRQ